MMRLEPVLSGASVDGLSSLDGLPWLSPDAPAASAFGGNDATAGARDGGTRHLLHAWLAAAALVMLGGAWYLTGGSAPQSVPVVEHVGDKATGPSGAARTSVED